MGDRHHLHPAARELLLLDGGAGLVQPVCRKLAIVRQLGKQLLRRGAGSGRLRGTPDIFNSDQGSQFTSQAFTDTLAASGIRISMDGKGSYHDNIFTERLWRSVKYEEVYLKEYATLKEAEAGLRAYFTFYNATRPHQALAYQTPEQVQYALRGQTSE